MGRGKRKEKGKERKDVGDNAGVTHVADERSEQSRL